MLAGIFLPLSVFFLPAQEVTISGDVTGPASSPVWTVGGDGTLTIGDTGVGSMSIGPGGTVNSRYSLLGDRPGSRGEASVVGGRWNNNDGFLIVSNFGEGRLTISDGAVVTSFNGQIGIAGPGHVTVSNANWTNFDDLVIGTDGTGTLETQAGAAVLNKNAHIGLRTGVGEARIAGGSWINAGGLFVGSGVGATGTLQVSSGEVLNGDASLGSLDNSTGTATVSGGLWSSSGTLHVGQFGRGSLRLTGGEVFNFLLSVASGATSTGAVHLDGGVLRTAQIVKGFGGGGGKFTFNGGTVRLIGDQGNLFGAFVNGDVKIDSGGASVDTQNFAVTIHVGMEGTGALTKRGSGSLRLNGANSFSGGVNVAEGTLRQGAAGALPLGAYAIETGAILDLNDHPLTASSLTGAGEVRLGSGSLIVRNSADSAFDGSLTGAGRLEKDGTGTLALAAGNAFSGGTTIRHGAISVPAASALGTGTISLLGGKLRPSAAFATEASITVDGSASALESSHDLTFAIDAVASPSIVSIVNGGRVATTGNATFAAGGGLGSGTITGPGSRLDVGQTLHLGVFNIGGVTVENGGVIRAGGVHLGAGGGIGVLNLKSGGTLEVGGTDGIRTNGTAHFNWEGGTLKVTNSSLTTSVGMALSNSSLIDTSGVNATLSGVLSGPGTLSKTGAGTLFLTGNNTHTGGTVLFAGDLQVEGRIGAVNVQPGARLGGGGAVGAITLESGGILAPGSGIGTPDSLGPLAGGSLLWHAGAVLEYELGGATGDLLSLAGGLRKIGGSGGYTFQFVDRGWQAGQTYTLLRFRETDFQAGDFGFANGGDVGGHFILGADRLQFTVQPVPEPSTWAVAIGLLLLAVAARRSRTKGNPRRVQ